MNMDTIDTQNNEQNLKTANISCEVMEHTTRSGELFYRVINSNNVNEVYFAFKNKMDSNSFELLSQKPTQLEIQYEEQIKTNPYGEDQIYRHIISVFNTEDFFI